MLGNCADSGSWAMHSPPTALTACAPAVPLEPMPLMMMQMARSRCSSARLLKKSSTGRLAARGVPSARPQVQPAVADRQDVAGADDVDVVRLDRHAVLDLAHRHGGAPGEDLGHHGSRGPAAGAGRGRTPCRCRAAWRRGTRRRPPARRPRPRCRRPGTAAAAAARRRPAGPCRSGSSSGCRASRRRGACSGRPRWAVLPVHWSGTIERYDRLGGKARPGRDDELDRPEPALPTPRAPRHVTRPSEYRSIVADERHFSPQGSLAMSRDFLATCPADVQAPPRQPWD